ncbi:MAG: hypothetical protein LBE49_06635, partial [Deltaproteobacteria bacterium]|nr:hypothetical protein [Deltaproteobacteria bacterium]
FYHDELAEIQKTILHSRWENQANILRQLSKITSHEAKKYTNFFDININRNLTFTYELNMDKLENEDKYCGYFCFLSKLNFDASKMLNIYQRKFFIDKELEGLVNYIDKKSPDEDSKLVTAGKLFCSFIGLIASSYIREKVRVLNESFGPQRLTKAKLISELEKIQMVVLGKTTRQVKPLAKIQSRLLASLGVDPNLLQSFELGSHS